MGAPGSHSKRRADPQFVTPLSAERPDRPEPEPIFLPFRRLLRNVLPTFTALIARLHHSASAGNGHRGLTMLQRRRHGTVASVPTAEPVIGIGRVPLVRVWAEDEQHWRVQWDRSEWEPGVFPNLTLALAFANSACGGRPATIEFRIGSFYAVVQQEQGWPKPIL
jgi:hypothetical protein